MAGIRGWLRLLAPQQERYYSRLPAACAADRMRPLRRIPPLALVVLVVAAGVVGAACEPIEFSISGAFPRATLYLDGVDETPASTEGGQTTPSPPLAVVPGATATIDLAKTLLRGNIGPKTPESGTTNPIGETVSKCIALAEWSLIGADGKVLRSSGGSRVWGSGESGNFNRCPDGARERTIDVPIPANITGVSLQLTVRSAQCGDTGCVGPLQTKALRLREVVHGIVHGPSLRDQNTYVDAKRWISGTFTIPLVPKASGLYYATNPDLEAHRSIGRLDLDGTGLDPTFLTASADVNAVAVRGRYLYWATGTAIGRANLDGTGANGSFITGLVGVAGIAVTDRYIFWIHNSPMPNVGRANLDGTGANQTWYPTAGGAAIPFLQYIAADAAHVYVASSNVAGTMPVNVFRRIPVGDPSAATDLAGGTAGSEGGAFAVDGTYLYLSGLLTGAGDGIGRMRLSTAATSGPVPFITPPAGYAARNGVAVDATHIYWVTESLADPTARWISRADLDGTGVDTTWLPLSGQPGSLAVASAASRRGAARRAARATAARASIRLAHATVLRPAKLVGYAYRDEILRGRYALATTGSGVPAGLRAFRGGRYVERIAAVSLAPSADGRTTTVIGTGTMLLRGRGGALLCVAIEANAVAANFAFTGGRGAGARLTGGLQTAPLRYAGTQTRAFGIAFPGGVETQTRTIAKRGALQAGTGSPRGLSRTCRSLLPYLRTAAPAPVTG